MNRTRVLIGLSVISALGIGLAYGRLPATIPLHWGLSGSVDGWGSRANVVWMALLPLAALGLFRVLPRMDPRKEAYVKNGKALAFIETSLVLFFVGLAWLVVATALGVPLDIGDWVRVGVGILFVVMGNFMGQLKRNYFVGIKTPWTLADDEVWRRTHRRGGWVFVFDGLLFIASVALPDGPVLVSVFIVLALSIVYVVAYSYFVWRALQPPADRA